MEGVLCLLGTTGGSWGGNRRKDESEMADEASCEEATEEVRGN